MSLFKDTVKADVKNVFLNADEFSDRHKIDGVEIVCQIDTDVIDPKDGSISQPLYGVFANTITLYVSSEAMKKPVEGQVLRIDDRRLSVRQVKDEMGIYVITLEENDS